MLLSRKIFLSIFAAAAPLALATASEDRPFLEANDRWDDPDASRLRPIQYMTDSEGFMQHFCQWVLGNPAIKFKDETWTDGDPPMFSREPGDNFNGNVDHCVLAGENAHMLEFKDDETVFVFGGDATTRGDGSKRIMRALVDFKARHPKRVFLIVGNRDAMLMRLTSEWVDPSVHSAWVREASSDEAFVTDPDRFGEDTHQFMTYQFSPAFGKAAPVAAPWSSTIAASDILNKLAHLHWLQANSQGAPGSVRWGKKEQCVLQYAERRENNPPTAREIEEVKRECFAHCAGEADERAGSNAKAMGLILSLPEEEDGCGGATWGDVVNDFEELVKLPANLNALFPAELDVRAKFAFLRDNYFFLENKFGDLAWYMIFANVGLRFGPRFIVHGDITGHNGPNPEPIHAGPEGAFSCIPDVANRDVVALADGTVMVVEDKEDLNPTGIPYLLRKDPTLFGRADFCPLHKGQKANGEAGCSSGFRRCVSGLGNLLHEKCSRAKCKGQRTKDDFSEIHELLSNPADIRQCVKVDSVDEWEVKIQVWLEKQVFAWMAHPTFVSVFPRIGVEGVVTKDARSSAQHPHKYKMMLAARQVRDRGGAALIEYAAGPPSAESSSVPTVIFTAHSLPDEIKHYSAEIHAKLKEAGVTTIVHGHKPFGSEPGAFYSVNGGDQILVIDGDTSFSNASPTTAPQGPGYLPGDPRGVAVSWIKLNSDGQVDVTSRVSMSGYTMDERLGIPNDFPFHMDRIGAKRTLVWDRLPNAWPWPLDSGLPVPGSVIIKNEDVSEQFRNFVGEPFDKLRREEKIHWLGPQKTILDHTCRTVWQAKLCYLHVGRARTAQAVDGFSFYYDLQQLQEVGLNKEHDPQQELSPKCVALPLENCTSY